MKNPIKKILSKIPRKSPLQKFLIQYAKSNEQPFFIQIGANDGVTEDPIHELVKKHQWKGLLVEPVPYLFNKLKENYIDQSSALNFENVAISREIEKRKMYFISDDQEDLPKWTIGLNSFNKEHILWQKRNFPNIEEYIKEETIDCIPLKELISKHSINKINLLLIDVEGYDYEILKQLESISSLPDVVIYEHQCLGNEKEDSQNFMKSKGYDIFESGGDTIAVREQV